MNELFNAKLQSWLNDGKRMVEDGCMLLLQLEGNRIHYDNLMRFPDKGKLMKYLVSELTRRLKARLSKVTHEKVEEMSKKVDVIVSKHFSHSKGTSDEEFRKGKRADHDQLPEEIQARYVENLSLLQRMREVHLKLRSLSTENVSCPDSERYPFLKELIELDKKLHENWEVYDHYVADAGDTKVRESAVKQAAAPTDAKATKATAAKPVKKAKAKK